MIGVTENAFDTSTGTFTVSNGVTEPAATDDMATLKADGDYEQKTITSVSYSTVTKKITTACYLSTLEANTVATITKLGLDNDNGTGKLIQEHNFAGITKNDGVELFITVYTTLADAS